MASANWEMHVTAFPLFVYIGVFEQEQVCGQEIWVSLCASVPKGLRPDGRPFLDYGELLFFMESEWKGKSVTYIEELLLDLTEALLRQFQVISELTVSIQKSVFPAHLNRGACISLKHSVKRGDTHDDHHPR